MNWSEKTKHRIDDAFNTINSGIGNGDDRTRDYIIGRVRAIGGAALTVAEEQQVEEYMQSQEKIQQKTTKVAENDYKKFTGLKSKEKENK